MLKKLLPLSIAGDKKFQAIADACDAELEKIDANAAIPAILSRIDELPEPVLDLLGWQFHVEGWELAQSIEEKRTLVKQAIELHKHKGTKWAIKKVLEILNLSGKIQEWFEYGGEPYKFKLHIDVNRTLAGDTVLSKEVEEKLLRLLSEYKNERSHLDEFSVGVRFDKELAITSAMNSLGMMRIECEQPPEREVRFDTTGLGIASATNSLGIMRIECEESSEHKVKFNTKLGIVSSMNNIGIIICGSV